MRRAKIQAFSFRREKKLPRRIRLKLAKRRRKKYKLGRFTGPRPLRWKVAIRSAIASVQELLDAFEEASTTITNPEAILRGAR